MKKNIFFILLILIFGCKMKNKKEEEINLLAIKEASINRMILKIESSKCYESKHIGFTGENSILYETYETLNQIASDSLWLKLTYSKSPVMRCYAYHAILSKQNNKLINEVKSRLINDTTRLDFYSCDIYEKGGTVSNFVKYLKI